MIIRNQKDCPYCHHETRRKHNVLLNYTFLTSDDDTGEPMYILEPHRIRH